MSKETLHIDREISKKALGYAIAGAFLVIFALSFTIVAYTPVRTLIPGYPSAQSRKLQVQNAIKIDSLERCIMRWELYTGNLRNVLEGRNPVKIDSLIHQFNAEYSTKDAGDLAKVDSSLRSQVQSVEKYEIPSGKSHVSIESKHFFKPVNGSMLQGFDQATHPCVDINVTQGSTVKAALDGYIIYTGWSATEGWCMIMQHDDNIISIYRHLGSLFKQTGDSAGAGMVIGLCGNVKQDTKIAGSTNSHLSFELWHEGKPVDPEQYIKF